MNGMTSVEQFGTSGPFDPEVIWHWKTQDGRLQSP